MKIVLGDYEVNIKAKSIYTPNKRCSKGAMKGILCWLSLALACAYSEAEKHHKNLLEGYFKDLTNVENALRKLEGLEPHKEIS